MVPVQALYAGILTISVQYGLQMFGKHVWKKLIYQNAQVLSGLTINLYIVRSIF